MQAAIYEGAKANFGGLFWPLRPDIQVVLYEQPALRWPRSAQRGWSYSQTLIGSPKCEDGASACSSRSAALVSIRNRPDLLMYGAVKLIPVYGLEVSYEPVPLLAQTIYDAFAFPI